MKPHLLSKSSLAAVCVLLAAQTQVQAQFTPIPLTQSSYTESMVVESNYFPTVNEYAVWVGSGYNQSDTTYFENGLYAREGFYGYNTGVPVHGTVFRGIGGATTNMQFIMPPSYTEPDDLVIVNGSRGTNTSGTLTLTTPVSAKSIALLAAGGNGGCTVIYTVNHSSGSPETGSYAVPDWFANGAENAWGCDGRINNGGYANFQVLSVQTGPPYMDAQPIKITNTAPVTSVGLAYTGTAQGVDNFFAVSTSPDGTNYVPAVVTGFQQTTIVAASTPFPVTATMDNGTNITVDPADTWFEQGYDSNNPTDGLPPSGTIFTSSSSSDTFQMGNYATNDAVLIDSTHLSANITPVTAAAYTGLAFLTSGANIGSGVMSNSVVVQHQDGVNETNWLFIYDWTNSSAPDIAFQPGEAVNLGPRIFDTATTPGLFESFVTVADTTAITNIKVGYGFAPAANSESVIMAVSGATAGWGPLILAGPTPVTQSWFPSQSATLSVDIAGGGTITSQWLVESAGGNYVPLVDGTDANGSVISGATTTTLTITDLKKEDGTNYEYTATSASGSVTSPTASIVILTTTPDGPSINSQTPTASFFVLTNHPDVTTFSVTTNGDSAPPVDYQWYAVTSGNVTNPIPGATAAIYNNVDTNNVTIFCVLSNFVGKATSAPVTITIVSTFGTQTQYGSNILALNPIAYWPLDEPSGVIAFDRAGTHDGQYIGGCVLAQPGIPNAAALVSNVSVGFNGSNAYVDIPAGKTDLNIKGPITIMQWVLTPLAGEAGFPTSFGHSDESYRLDVVPTSAIPHFADSGPDVVSPNNINDGNWHMLAGVFDGINENLYVDGVAQGGQSPSEPPGNQIDVWIGGAPDYGLTRLFNGNISQCAIFTNAMSAAQIKSLYDAAELAPINLAITPANPTVYVGRNVTLAAAASLGSPITSYQWYVINSGISNTIPGATSATYTLTDATLAENGETLGVIAGNVAGSLNASVTLTVNDVAASLATDIMPTNAEAVIGTSVTYSVTAAGSLPISYQWTTDGTPVSGATDSSFTFNAASGKHLIQVSFTNALSAGTPVLSSVASLTGLASIAPITFANNGAGWVTNTSVPMSTTPYFTNDELFLCDGVAQGEASAAFWPIGQFVGSFTASYVFTVHTYAIPSGDGATFMIQDSGGATNEVGGIDGGIGYNGITNSIALEMDFWGNGSGNASAGVGINAETNGITYNDGGGPLYGNTGNISLDSGDPILFNLSWANGILAVNMEDQSTSAKYSTNYNLGDLVPLLGANLAYVGFSGANGDANSIIWISDFVFQPGVAAPPGVTLTVSKPVAGSIELSWPTSATGFAVYQAGSLSGPWTASSAPVVVVGANNTVTISTSGASSTQFYRLEKP
jgi:Concanavalin A-like lectin/glucanases superfamily/Legume lectin domain